MATLLEAINILLVAKSVTPITEVEAGHPDVSAATAILNRTKRTVNSIKWYYNTELDIDVPIDVNGNCNLPSTVISLDNDQNYIIMQGKLYDVTTRTNVFTEGVEELTFIHNRDWPDMPIQAFDYVCALAKEEFIRSLESSIMSGQAEKDITRCKAVLDITDFRFKDVSKPAANPLMLKWQQKMIVR